MTISHDVIVGAEACYCSFSTEIVILFKPLTRDREIEGITRDLQMFSLIKYLNTCLRRRTNTLRNESSKLIDFFFPVALRPNECHEFLILEVSRSHTTTHHSR